MSDDYASNLLTTGTLVAGATVQAKFDFAGDSDWFKIHLEAGKTYLFSMTGSAKGGGTLLDTFGQPSTLRVRDGAGNLLGHASELSPVTGNLPVMPYTVANTGDYFIDVTGGTAGTYTLAASLAPNDDYADLRGGATPITIGSARTGQIGTINDIDWFSVHLNAGVPYQFSLSASSGAILSRLSDAKGNDVYLSSPQAGILAGAVAVSGDYFFNVSSSTTSGAYTLNATAVPDDYPASTATPGKLQVNGLVNGRIDAYNEVDYIKLQLNANDLVAVHLSYDGAATNGVTYGVTGVDSHGNPVNFALRNDDVISTTGLVDYYLRVTGTLVANYQISMAAQVDDIKSSESLRLTPQAPVNARIDYVGDTDAFTLKLQSGHLYTLTYKVTGALTNLPYSPFNIGFTNLSDHATNVGMHADNQNNVYSVSLKALDDSELGIIVSSSASVAFNYSMEVTDLVGDDVGDTESNATAFTCGQTVAAKIDYASDLDVFKVHLDAGVSYVFTPGDALAHNLGLTPKSPFPVSTATATMFVTPTQSGDFYFYASGVNGKTGAYTIQSALAQDDYAANSATKGVLSLNASVLGVLETPADRDWFGITLDAGTTYDFSAKGVNQLALFDSAGNKLAGVTAATAPTLQWTPSANGRYFVSVAWQDNNVDYVKQDKNYSLSAAIGKPDDVPAPVHLNLGSQFAGKLETASDTDDVLVNLDAAHFYQFYLQTRNSSGQFVPIKHALTVDQMDGNAVLGQLTMGADSQGGQVVAPAMSGTYRLAINSTLMTAGSEYRLTVIDSGTRDDMPDQPGTVANLAVGATVHDAIQVAGDQDAFTLALASGRLINFALSGSATGGGTLALPSDLRFILEQLADHSQSGIIFPGETLHLLASPTVGGLFGLTVGSAGNAGSYTLQATDVTADHTAPVLSATAPSTLAFNGSISLTFNEAIMRNSSTQSNVALFEDNTGQITFFGNNDMRHLAFSDHSVTVKPDFVFWPGKSYTLSFNHGVVLDMAMNPLADGSYYSFSVAPAATAPGAGSDVYIGNRDAAHIDGGAGIDSVLFSGLKAGTVFSNDGRGGVNVSNEGKIVNTLSGIERVYFAQEKDAIALDINGTGGAVYRVYQAAFNRTPDKAGIGFWMAAVDHGASLRDVEQGFMASAEFQAAYGANASDAEFVAHLYQNVLHRAGEPSGVDYWVGTLQQGVARVDVLAGFSESPENVSAVAAIIGNGFAFTPYAG